MLEVRSKQEIGSLVANNKISFNVEEGVLWALSVPMVQAKLLSLTVSQVCIDLLQEELVSGYRYYQFTSYKVARLGAVRTFQIVHSLKEMSVFDNVLIGAYLRKRYRKSTRAHRAMYRNMLLKKIKG